MKILRSNLKPSWKFRTELKVWRLLPGNGVLATELRDPDGKVTEYAGIDISSGNPLWEGLKLEESWWIFMNRIFRDVLLLQQYVKPDMPTPGKIFAVDLLTGRLLWEKHDLTYLDAAGDMVYGIRKSIRSGEIVGLGFRDGEEKLVIPSDDPRADSLTFPPQEDGFILSGFFEEIEESLTPDRASALLKITPANARNPTYIPSVSGRDIIGFYTDAGKDEKGIPVFDSHLRVADSAGKFVFDDLVDRKVYTTLGDFYFIVGKSLIYARNSNEIVAVDLER